jgi:predicted phage terminase large subunit-like protein
MSKAIIGCYVDDRYRDFLAEIGKVTTLEDGDPVWPEHFDKDTLRRIAAKAGPADFSRQWLNIAITDEDTRFSEEDFQFYSLSADRESLIIEEGDRTRSIPFSRLYRSMTIDPATGEGNNTDESAITITGYDRMTGKIFLLDAWDKRVLPFDLINMIIQKAKAWRPHVIAPEDVSFQKTLKHFLQQEMNKAGVHFPIRPVKPGTKSKGARILDSLQPFIANKQFYVMRNRAQRRVIDEAINVQIVDGKVVGRSPNLLDSLAYHADFWRGQVFARDKDEREASRGYRSNEERAYGLSVST